MNELEYSAQKKTLLLRINNLEIPEALLNEAKNNNFKEKQEYHMTIIGFPLGFLLKKVSQDVENKIINLIENTQFNIEYLDEYFLIRKEYKNHTRESIIQKLTVIGLSEFFEKLKKITGLEIEEAFPHLTLFTRGDEDQKYPGIGINSHAEFKKYLVGEIDVSI